MQDAYWTLAVTVRDRLADRQGLRREAYDSSDYLEGLNAFAGLVHRAGDRWPGVGVKAEQSPGDVPWQGCYVYDLRTIRPGAANRGERDAARPDVPVG